MKAFEAKTQTSQAQYEIIMGSINNAIKDGKTSLFIQHGEKFPEQVIQKIAREGFDVKIVDPGGWLCKNMTISWENAEEGRSGVIIRERIQESGPIPRKRSFWERIDDFIPGEGGDW